MIPATARPQRRPDKPTPELPVLYIERAKARTEIVYEKTISIVSP